MVDKKFLIIIPIVIVLIAVIGYSYSENIINFNNATVGSTSFNIPNGYSVVNHTEDKITIKNNDHELTISELDSDQLSAYLEKHKDAYDISVTDSNINNITAKKTTATDKKSGVQIHMYWFTKDNKNYFIRLKPDDSSSRKAMLYVVKTFNATK